MATVKTIDELLYSNRANLEYFLPRPYISSQNHLKQIMYLIKIS